MKPQTIVINNFGGRLTRIINGDLNSGFAKFDTSFGYDPFTKPMNLTWLAQPTSIAGLQRIPFNTEDVVIDGVNRAAGGGQTTRGDVYLTGANNMVYQVSNATFSVLARASISGSYGWGASMQFFGQNEKIYITGNETITTIGSVTGVGTFSLGTSASIIANSGVVQETYHPLAKFGGKLIFGNGPSIGAIDATGTVVSSILTVNLGVGNQYSEISPALPSTEWVRDLDVSVDGNYLYLSASSILPEYLFLEPPLGLIFAQFERGQMVPGEGGIYGWNGTDKSLTTSLKIPSGVPAALQTYLQELRMFFSDILGTAVGDGTEKIYSLPKNKLPLPNATDVNGNFLVWANPEALSDGSRVASLYYAGSLDAENPVGLYRMLRWSTPLQDGFVYQIPYQGVVRNSYSTTPSVSLGADISSLGTHFISTYSVSQSVYGIGSVGTGRLLRFDVSSDENTTPQLGVYETQTQLFSKRIHIEQIRVYTESTVAGNGFQLDIIGVDGDPIENGTFTYSFAAGDDITKLQGSLQRINFNPKAEGGYGFGIRITNTGTTNMTIKKIEIDWGPEGR